MGEVRAAGWGGEPDAMRIPDLAIADSLGLALAVALAGSAARPRLGYPTALRPILRATNLSAKQLRTVRTAVEADDSFRARVQDAASPDLLDEVGMAWLTRPAGWAETVSQHVGTGSDDADGAGDLARESRRREAAQRLAATAQAELATLRAVADRQQRALDELAAELRTAAAKATKFKTAASESETARRRAEAQAARAADKLAGAYEQRDAALQRAADAEAARDSALIDHVQQRVPLAVEPGVDLAKVRTLMQQAIDALDAEPVATPKRSAPIRGRIRSARQPIAVPGGLLGDSAAVAEHYLKTPGVKVLVDGYNVAKLGWPGLDLDRQRLACIDAAETVARKWGARVTVVFDGADVVGASAEKRRFVRVTYSPAGVLADDVVRDEVAATDISIKVVVVTNDQGVIASVRVDGANTISSDQFLALALR